ncbi:MAG: 30S ribosomal protein S20, partial [Planctomycetota bacterium]
MAHSLSAKKRVKQNAKSRTINRGRKSQIKTQIKHFETALSSG